ncbi:MAG: ABC transporter permease [Nitrospinota bacterium]
MYEQVCRIYKQNIYLYLIFLLKSFNKEKAYKFEYVIGILNGLLFIFIFTSLWSALYNASTNLSALPFNKGQMIAYAVYAMLIKISLTQEESSIPANVRSGQIAMDMIKPINFIRMHLAQALGQTMFHWVTRVIPIAIVTFIFFDININISLNLLIIVLISWIFGYLILFYINFMFAMLAFWFVEVFGFQLMKFALMTLFAGGILPIDFFPESMQPFIKFLPFQYIIYAPTSILIGHNREYDIFYLIIGQLIWVILLYAAARFVWFKGQTKLIVQGG